MKTKRVPTIATIRRVTIIWAGGLIILTSVMMAQTVRGTVYGNEASKAWAWLLPQILPTFSLCVVSLQAQEKKRSRQSTSVFLSMLTTAGALAVLTVMILTVLSRPFSGMAPLDWFALSAAWLAPMHTTFMGILGALLSGETSGGK